MYEEFFGLTGQPFQLNPDPSFYFESRGHKRAFAYLTYGLYQGEGFIVITGEIGAGKTTLVRCLLEQIDPNRIVAANLVSTQLDAEDLLRAVATGFGIPAKGETKAQLLAELEAYFVSLVPHAKRPVLIVDEAQNLTQRAVEELRMLSNFQLGKTSLVQSILIGQPELRELMRGSTMRQLGQRVLASYHLGPMGKDETRHYIEHRLRKVGWNGKPSFSDEFFTRIHDASGGIPRRINTLANRALLFAYLNEQYNLGAPELEEVLAELKEESALGLDMDEMAAEGAVPTRRFTESDFGAPKLASMLSIAEAMVLKRKGRGRGKGAPAEMPLEERVERLEKAVITMLDVLVRLTHRNDQVRPATPPAPAATAANVEPTAPAPRPITDAPVNDRLAHPGLELSPPPPELLDDAPPSTDNDSGLLGYLGLRRK
ncbi:MAG: XrtA-associated ATPase [Burkholderiales bacterium]|nr:XrtA-associated ATPase [Burkholderiales bacterium]